MLRTSEMEMQAASHRRALLASEQQASDSGAESRTLQAELAQLRQSLAAVKETESKQAFELREQLSNLSSEASAMQVRDARARELQQQLAQQTEGAAADIEKATARISQLEM